MFSNRTSYFTAGLAGVVAGAVAVVVVGRLTGASWTTMVVCIAAPLVSFAFGIKVRHIIEGRERLVLLEGFVWAVTGTGLALWVTGEPVLAGLDLVVVGIGLFLVFGRLGCLSIGCCHGRPHRWGVRYDSGHVDLGFPHYYQGVALLPIQAFGSAGHLGLVSGCALLELSWHPDGSVLAFWIALYGPARFAVELMRGDPERGYALGLSYAQWSCLLLVWIAVAALPGFPGLQLASAVAVSVAALVVVALRRRLALTSANHVRELFEVLERLANSRADVPVEQTSQRLRVSRTSGHFALSRPSSGLNEAAARSVAHYIALFEGLGEVVVEAGKTPGVFHVRSSPAPGPSDRGFGGPAAG